MFQNPTNVTGIYGLFQHANNLTGGILGLIFCVMIFLISFISTKQYTWQRSMAFSSFLTFIVAMLLRFMSMINDAIFFGVIALLVISMILLWWDKE